MLTEKQLRRAVDERYMKRHARTPGSIWPVDGIVSNQVKALMDVLCEVLVEANIVAPGDGQGGSGV